MRRQVSNTADYGSSVLTTSGRTVLISGANRGVGNAIARRLHAAGYQVSAGARDPDALATSLADLDDERLLCHEFDATIGGSDRRWVDDTLARFGSLDVVINNAGLLDTSPLEDLTMDHLDAMLEVNLKAPLRIIQLALPHLRACGTGRVVNMASLSGLRVKGVFAPGYAMTKHAVVALSEATKQAAWDDGVRVVSVCPGFVATDMVADLGEAPESMIQPDDLAEAIATVIALPNTASVAQLNVACRLEPHF